MNIGLKKLSENKIMIYDNEKQENFIIEDSFSSGNVFINLCVEGLDNYLYMVKKIQENPKFSVLSFNGVTDMKLDFLFNNISVNLQYSEQLDEAIFIELNKNEINNYDEIKQFYRMLALSLHKIIKEKEGKKDGNKSIR